ncbi:MAG: polysaccharide deacetylase family protein [Bacteroidia bacterium]
MIKKITRNILFPLIYRLGIPGLLLRRANKNFVLCYHGVSQNPNFNVNNRHIKIKQFERDIIFYKKYFDVISIPEIFEIGKIDKAKKPKLVLTFDDGYLNNFTNILPIAEKHKVPVTFFIITAGLDNPDFITWYDLLDFVKLSKPNDIQLNNKIYKKMPNGGYYFDDELIDASIKLMGSEREKVLADFYNRYKKEVENFKNQYTEYWKLVDREGLRDSIGSKFLTIGSHTHLHYNLGNINNELLETELTTSKEILSEISDYEILSIAFPDGSYNENVKDLTTKSGYKFQLAVDYKLANDLNDPRILKRYSVSNSTTHEANMLKLALKANKYGF